MSNSGIGHVGAKPYPTLPGDRFPAATLGRRASGACLSHRLARHPRHARDPRPRSRRRRCCSRRPPAWSVVPGTEPTMLFAGFNVYQGHLTLLGIIIVRARSATCSGPRSRTRSATSAEHELLERQGSKLHVSRARLDRAHRWFERWGSPVVVLLAADPGGAGAVPVRGRRRARCRSGGSSSLADARLDPVDRRPRRRRAGGRQQLAELAAHLEYVDYVGAAIVVGVIAYLIVRRTARRTAEAPATGCRLLTRAPERAPADRRGARPRRAARAGRAAADLLLGPRGAGAVAARRWRYVELDDELRKSFEVALHAGTAAALLITLRDEVDRGRPRPERPARWR